MIPGEYFIVSDRLVAANAGRKTTKVRVSNTGNRPVQVG
jgi:urease beta subunit